ncbi:zinc-dependent alcohol dehydrogenase [Carboxylicivirga caseinilyticus]|uniref:zinc-dependent alcohol dehydrogenase n=1 Tax=Carboxylicivirga caseinilyticus TaxID=3417572 RepID=UPI003D341363|nr:alcohol dehydrogenase catalytic domain-containing protein [Marinilabiliaceae bacterium A049]
MKAVKISGIRKIGVYDVKETNIVKADEVKVAIKSVGVCGSDIHYYNEGNIGSQVVEYPWGVGHEASGEVLEVGAEVKDLKIGDKVAIEPTVYCGVCSECLNDRRHTCLNQKFLGCPGQMEGCMSETFVIPQICCVKVPDHLTPQLAAFAEPLSIGLYAYKLSAMHQKDFKVAILGAGPIGLTVLASCLHGGQKHITVIEPLEYRKHFAKECGAASAFTPDEEVEIKKQAELGYDVVYECCGKQEALDQALRILKPGGKLMFVGIPETQSLSFNMDMMRRKEICVQNVRRQNNSFEEAIDMIAGNPDYYQNMISHDYKVDQAGLAFEKVAAYSDNVIKAMVNF